VSESDHQLPEPAQRFSWKGVEEQVAAVLILLAAGGIGFMVWTQPRQLDLVLRNQQIITERAAVMENRLGKVEDNIVILDRRTTRLEAGR
jgi:hypothetical protein